MQISLKLLSIFFLFHVGSSTLKNTDTSADNEIVWEQGKRLTWDDFKGKPDPDTHLHAYTRTSLKSDFVSNTQTSAVLAVTGYFVKNESWVMPEQKTDKLLAHEQLHFDLNELYRRKLANKLENHNGFTFKNFSQEASKIFQEVFNEMASEQKRYDQETQHSKIDAKQKEWEANIAAELKKWNKYQGTEITVQVN